MRRMEFKMERVGVCKVGDRITVTEGLLPSGYYYYTIDPVFHQSFLPLEVLVWKSFLPFIAPPATAQR